MVKTKSSELQIYEVIEEVLGQIIDEWYERVAPHYITQEQLPGQPGNKEAELKYFHDESGHRIKFNKHELDFTYGLRSYCDDRHCVIEISVNNKVENFDYQDFQSLLVSHYRDMGNRQVPTPYQLKSFSYENIFQLEPTFESAFSVEQRKGKADIMRLSFRVSERFTKELISHPVSSKQLIEDYCVSPFRRIYATVYRRKSR
ncbi:hypothetical protein MYX82_12235 [Acidobacteria bacterium AH-259-D05]|nr:hypothetical protein [Acidobacteria bacterium AH-259-D05]